MTIGRVRPQPAAPDRGYNLFRKQLSELLCAVPEDYPAPDFVIAEDWLFERPLRPSDIAPPGSHARAAATGGRRVLFYSGDDARAKAEVGALIDRLGFFGIDLGPLSVGGRLVQFPGGPLPAHNFVRFG